MKLYDYFRSSAAYRVRIALNLKGLDYQQISVNLKDGEQAEIDYKAHNSQGLVPTLYDGRHKLQQSLAICEYLEEKYPRPTLLPTEPSKRAHVRAMAQITACDIHPLNNLRVLKYLVKEIGVSEEQKLAWYQHWIADGFAALETMVEIKDEQKFCFGGQPTLADICLVPQMYNARRFECPLDDYPKLVKIETHCLSIPAFDTARPEQRADANL